VSGVVKPCSHERPANSLALDFLRDFSMCKDNRVLRKVVLEKGFVSGDVYLESVRSGIRKHIYNSVILVHYYNVPESLPVCCSFVIANQSKPSQMDAADWHQICTPQTAERYDYSVISKKEAQWPFKQELNWQEAKKSHLPVHS
jgi:hypothetical protein